MKYVVKVLIMYVGLVNSQAVAAASDIEKEAERIEMNVPDAESVYKLTSIAKAHPQDFRDLAACYSPETQPFKVSRNSWARMAQLCNLIAVTRDPELVRILLIQSRDMSEKCGHPFAGYLESRYPSTAKNLEWHEADQAEKVKIITAYSKYTGK
jgi:hypothetical protein